MTNVIAFKLSIHELSRATGLDTQDLLSIVEHGIVDAEGSAAQGWTFHRASIPTVQKAHRLHSDLGINWGGIALALDLLNELEQMREENRSLKRRLQRFSSEPI